MYKIRTKNFKNCKKCGIFNTGCQKVGYITITTPGIEYNLDTLYFDIAEFNLVGDINKSVSKSNITSDPNMILKIDNRFFRLTPKSTSNKVNEVSICQTINQDTLKIAFDSIIEISE